MDKYDYSQDPMDMSFEDAWRLVSDAVSFRIKSYTEEAKDKQLALGWAIGHLAVAIEKGKKVD